MISEIDLLRKDIPRLEKTFGASNPFVKVLKAQLLSADKIALLSYKLLISRDVLFRKLTLSNNMRCFNSTDHTGPVTSEKKRSLKAKKRTCLLQ